MRWADLDPDLGEVHVLRSLQTSGGKLVFDEPKTRRSRRAVAVPEFLLPYLHRQRDAQAARRERCAAWVDLDLVIDAANGRPLNPDTTPCPLGGTGSRSARGCPIRFQTSVTPTPLSCCCRGFIPRWCPNV